MNQQRLIKLVTCLCLGNRIDDAGHIQLLRERLRDDFTRVQIHNARQVDKAICCPNVGDIGAPDSVRSVWIELLMQDVLQTFAEV